jgi:hypothetical protein
VLMFPPAEQIYPRAASLLTFTVVSQDTSYRLPGRTLEPWRRGCVSGRSISKRA